MPLLHPPAASSAPGGLTPPLPPPTPPQVFDQLTLQASSAGVQYTPEQLFGLVVASLGAPQGAEGGKRRSKASDDPSLLLPLSCSHFHSARARRRMPRVSVGGEGEAMRGTARLCSMPALHTHLPPHRQLFLAGTSSTSGGRRPPRARSHGAGASAAAARRAPQRTTRTAVPSRQPTVKSRCQSSSHRRRGRIGWTRRGTAASSSRSSPLEARPLLAETAARVSSQCRTSSRNSTSSSLSLSLRPPRTSRPRVSRRAALRPSSCTQRTGRRRQTRGGPLDPPPPPPPQAAWGAPLLLPQAQAAWGPSARRPSPLTRSTWRRCPSPAPPRRTMGRRKRDGLRLHPPPLPLPPLVSRRRSLRCLRPRPPAARSRRACATSSGASTTSRQCRPRRGRPLLPPPLLRLHRRRHRRRHHHQPQQHRTRRHSAPAASWRASAR